MAIHRTRARLLRGRGAEPPATERRTPLDEKLLDSRHLRTPERHARDPLQLS